jgi:molybdenum cofactor synthesis domain-containing protein
LKAALLILSDKGAAGEREDITGVQMRAWLEERGVEIGDCTLLADDEEDIARYLGEQADNACFDLIITCGGTGVAPRDRTPEATRRVLDFEIPGLAEAMRRASVVKTPAALLSRALAGVRSATLIINLPGSPKGAQENLEAVWDAIPHAVAKIQGDTRDCAEM